MDKRVRLRRSILLIALTLTVIASFYPDQKTVKDGGKRHPERVTATKTEQTAGQVNADPSKKNTPVAEVDPFSARNWIVEPITIVEAPVVTVNAIVTPPPVVTGPPPLPFKFTGRMNDEGNQVVYLNRGEQMVLAHIGDVLDSSYKVISITQQQIEFEYLPSGEKQTLALPASEY